LKNILQSVLNKEIPLTNAIGLEIINYSHNEITVFAPLEKNINHKCTAFGGSLYSVCVLAGWSLIYALLKENNVNGHIVIQESNIKYLKPVDQNIKAQCSFNDNAHKMRFLKTYQRKNKARIQLTTKILQNDNDAVIFTGSYVVHQ